MCPVFANSPYRSGASRSGRAGPDHSYAIFARPPEGLTLTDATRRLLWGVLTGGVAWLVLSLADGTAPLIVGWGIAASVALLDLPGIAVGAVGAAIAAGHSDSPAKAFAVALIVACAAMALGSAATRMARRSGGLALDALIVASTLGVLALGPAGGLVAPVVVAIAQIALGRSP